MINNMREEEPPHDEHSVLLDQPKGSFVQEKAKKMGLIDTVGSYSTALNITTQLLEKAGYDTKNREVLIALPTPAQDEKQEHQICSPDTTH